MNKSVVFMFSGQGSQYYNMGRELFLLNSSFRNQMMDLNEIYKSITGESVIKLMYDRSRTKDEAFEDLRYTHPAIFMLEYSLAALIMKSGISPQYVLGSSLGEYTAAAIAGVMSCEDAFGCVIKQAEIVESTCLKGGMLAVLSNVGMYEKEPILYRNSELASVNYPSHFVVAGNLDGLSKIEDYLKTTGNVYQRLPISFAFHSALIDPAAHEFTELLKSKYIQKPKINYISCMSGGRKLSFEDDYFWDVVRKPANFVDAIKEVEKPDKFVYIDLGPSGTLANFTKYCLGIESIQNIYPVITPYNNLKNFNRVMELTIA